MILVVMCAQYVSFYSLRIFISKTGEIVPHLMTSSNNEAKPLQGLNERIESGGKLMSSSGQIHLMKQIMTTNMRECVLMNECIRWGLFKIMSHTYGLVD